MAFWKKCWQHFINVADSGLVALDGIVSDNYNELMYHTWEGVA